MIGCILAHHEPPDRPRVRPRARFLFRTRRFPGALAAGNGGTPGGGAGLRSVRPGPCFFCRRRFPCRGGGLCVFAVARARLGSVSPAPPRRRARSGALVRPLRRRRRDRRRQVLESRPFRSFFPSFRSGFRRPCLARLPRLPAVRDERPRARVRPRPRRHERIPFFRPTGKRHRLRALAAHRLRDGLDSRFPLYLGLGLSRRHEPRRPFPRFRLRPRRSHRGRRGFDEFRVLAAERDHGPGAGGELAAPSAIGSSLAVLERRHALQYASADLAERPPRPHDERPRLLSGGTLPLRPLRLPL